MELTKRLASWESKIERAIHESAKAIAQDVKDTCASIDKAMFAFDAELSRADLLGLSHGKDAHYDRITVGLRYFLHYHSRRFSDLVRVISTANWSDRSQISILDIGCGTGAGFWAAYIVWLHNCLEPNTRVKPQLLLRGIDSSPFMLNASGIAFQKLREEFHEEYVAAGGPRIKVDFTLKNWTDVKPDDDSDPWIIASHIVDHSEKQRTIEIAKELQDLCERFQPERLLWISSGSKKEASLQMIKNAVPHAIEVPLTDSMQLPWRGKPLETLRQFYVDLDKEKAVTPEWDDPFTFKAHFLIQRNLLLPGHNPRSGLSLVELDKHQRAIVETCATHVRVFITGPAGSGKTLLLEKMMENFIANYRQDDSGLFLAFNRAIVWHVAKNLARAFYGNSLGVAFDPDPSKFDIQSLPNSCVVKKNDSPIIQLETLDKRATKLSEGRRQPVYEKQSPPTKYEFDHEFVRDEYKQCIYGKACGNRDKYLDTSRSEIRKGRKRPLNREEREEIYRRCMQTPPDEFIERRIAALARLNHSAKSRTSSHHTFSHIWIDEAQDFSWGDFALTELLLGSNGHLVAAADRNQSIQLGGTFSVPPTTNTTASWKRQRLRGSYRISRGIADVLVPLNKELTTLRDPEHDESTSDHIPLKRSVPGFRPVLLHSDETDKQDWLAEQIDHIVKLFKVPVTATNVGILHTWTKTGGMPPQIQQLNETLKNRGIRSNCLSIQKCKGLEFDIVILNLSLGIQHDVSPDSRDLERLYATITRASRLLICVTHKAIDPCAKQLLRDRNLWNPWHKRANLVLASISDKSARIEREF